MRVWLSSVFFVSFFAFAVSSHAAAAVIEDQSGNGHTGTLGVGFTGATSPMLNGSYASFTKPTDTISLAGNISLSNQITYEAIARLSSIPTSGEGKIWGSWVVNQQDTRLAIGTGGSLLGYSNPVNFPNAISAGALTTGVWYDLAYVYDGPQERLYVDGALIGSRPASGNAEIASSNEMTLGAIYRDGFMNPGLLGDLKSVRVSDTARYLGNSYNAAMDYFNTDSSTQLLYNLPEPSMALGPAIAFGGFVLRRPRRRMEEPQPAV